MIDGPMGLRFSPRGRAWSSSSLLLCPRGHFGSGLKDTGDVVSDHERILRGLHEFTIIYYI